MVRVRAPSLPGHRRGVVAQKRRQSCGQCIAPRLHRSRVAQPTSSWSQQAYRRPDADCKMHPRLEPVLPKVAQPRPHRSLLLCEQAAPIVQPLDHLEQRRQRGFRVCFHGEPPESCRSAIDPHPVTPGRGAHCLVSPEAAIPVSGSRTSPAHDCRWVVS